MVLTVAMVPVLMGAFLLLMERFEARLLGVVPPDVDDELLAVDSTFARPLGVSAPEAARDSWTRDRKCHFGATRAAAGVAEAGVEPSPQA